jgi:uncharacterized protein (DUF302 family)
LFLVSFHKDRNSVRWRVGAVKAARGLSQSGAAKGLPLACRSRLEAAIEKNGMLVVTTASASAAAKARGITIPGNAVLGVFRPDFAVRMLAASVPAGIEAPLRFYLTENDDGTATLTYRKPSAVFAPYGSAALDAMAGELDAIWSRIVTDAIGS